MRHERVHGVGVGFARDDARLLPFQRQPHAHVPVGDPQAREHLVREATTLTFQQQ